MGAILPFMLAFVDKVPSMIEAGIEMFDIFSTAETVIAENKVVGDPEWEALDESVKKHKAEFEAAARD